MQVLCKISHQAAETHCSVCGQGFNLVWERISRAERVDLLQQVGRALRGHHRGGPGTEAHPQRAFLVGNGLEAGSAAAVAGHAPSWAL